MTELPQFKKYGCPVCPQQFATLAGKKQHIRAEHPKTKGKRS